ncbi:MAG: Uncharacterised protein [Flavobacteriia bacterium]|nr:MAG: Uncharacterised protein [Flavobacteriia bacterium]
MLSLGVNIGVGVGVGLMSQNKITEKRNDKRK